MYDVAKNLHEVLDQLPKGVRLVARHIDSHLVDDTTLSLGKAQRVYYISLGNWLLGAILLCLGVSYFGFKPCTHS